MNNQWSNGGSATQLGSPGNTPWSNTYGQGGATAYGVSAAQQGGFNSTGQWQGPPAPSNASFAAQLQGSAGPSGASSGMNGADLFAALQGSVAPQQAQYDLMGKQLLLNTNQNTQMTGLNQQNLRDQTSIQMARANKMIENSQASFAHAKAGEGFVNQLYGEANKSAGIQYGAQRASLLSDATSRGAVNAHGTIGQFGNQYQAFQNQLMGNTTQRNQSMSDLKLAEQQATNLGQQYGLDKVALTDRLTNGLATIGLQGQINASDILKNLYGNDANKAQLSQTVITALLGDVQQNPSLMGTGGPGNGGAPGGGVVQPVNHSGQPGSRY